MGSSLGGGGPEPAGPSGHGDAVRPGRGSPGCERNRSPDHGGDQRRPGRGGAAEEREEERPGGQNLLPTQRYELTLSAEAREDLRQLKRRAPKVHGEIQVARDP